MNKTLPAVFLRKLCPGFATTVVVGMTLFTRAAMADVADDTKADPSPPPAIGSILSGYKLVWSDEFNTDGAPDPTKWTYQNGFVRNKELQWYQPDNARCEKGLLVIEARREHKPNPNYQAGSTNWKTNREFIEYTSTDLVTKGLGSWQYGRFEMRGRIDTRSGLWPAFWAEGIGGSWPVCGEVDVMEFYRSMVLANYIYPGGDKSVRTPLAMLDPDWSAKFHVWTWDWDADRMTISVDGVVTNTMEIAIATARPGEPANLYRQPFFLLLNLAVGSTGGNPAATPFPARFEVDYVRVYQKDAR